jgi:hypothetical protein
MSTPDLGKRLYELLPAVYRTRDCDTGYDLKKYLDACGELLDSIHATLEQRLADAFPDQPLGGLACQEWLLPYFADLVDARLVSPDVRGRRAEIASAIAWRQRKGTTGTIEAIAEAVGQFEVEVQEGWKRVATTPRIGLPLLPATALGYANQPHAGAPGLVARHPGLPAALVDFRCPSRAVRADAANPAAHSTRFDSQVSSWRQASVHGVPCFPGSYEDVSRRTVDLRTPTWRQGHYHPRRLLLHTPPPAGFFATVTVHGALRVKNWNMPGTTVAYKPAPLDQQGYVMEFPLAAPVTNVSPQNRAMLLVTRGGVTHGVPMVVTRVTAAALSLQGPEPPAALRFPAPGDAVELIVGEAVVMDWDQRAQARHAGVFEEVVEQGNVRVFRNRTVATPWFVPVHIRGVIELDSETGSGDQSYRFEHLIMRHTVIVHRNRVTLFDCAARKIEVHTIDITKPVLVARSCLFEAVQAARGLSRLEYCTVLQKTLSEALQASDCIFLGPLRRHHLSPEEPAGGCLRFSRIQPEQATNNLSVFRCSRDPVVMFSMSYGERSCGVLHPETAESVRSGAEDGGEMGAYHDRYYSLRPVAVVDKVRDHIPLGMEPVVIPDPRLLALPHE